MELSSTLFPGHKRARFENRCPKFGLPLKLVAQKLHVLGWFTTT